ncbi:type 4 prepilin peptidase 1, Aspartic peptidase, MEROPS family A24A [Anaeromyxobacter dehalogenans 2CP-C]|uniref:Prepilin leader peptidase/N-methyltransferase n=2 Tax=Anaeromyxobacter dehalogenans TaxID=161493 RepID=Q2INN0_ANADE|nr:type 4 prepilin peptidase 1, Aspartic peptidase, MEROPS family A24A [Anaeromyxobacter dehalogenans 2CP-C]
MDPAMPGVPAGLIAAWVALVGGVVGSFLNVVIARVPAGESIVSPGSRCPRCRTPIAWYDNVPVVSWLVLRARCRSCRAPISARYPLVEALVAGVALLAWARHGLAVAALGELVLVSLLVALAFIDLDTWLLPHALTWPLIATGLAAAAAGLGPATLQGSAIGAAVGFLAFALVSVVGEKVLHKEALGFGDVWLLSGIGAWLGVAALLPVVLLASVQGSVVGLVLLALGKGQPGPQPPAEAAAPPAPSVPGDPAVLADADDWVPPRNAVPFGPFLAAGALEWLYLADLIVRGVPSLELFR